MRKLFYLFRRGHHTYTSLVLSLLNFFTLQYTLLVKDIPTLSYLFFICLILYFPVAVLLGHYDHKKNLPVDSTLLSRNSPYARDTAKALVLLAEGKNKEVVEVMKKWV